MDIVRLDHLPSVYDIVMDTRLVKHWQKEPQQWILPDLWTIVLSFLWAVPFTYSVPWQIFYYHEDCVISAQGPGVGDFWLGMDDERSYKIEFGLGEPQCTISGNHRVNLRSLCFQRIHIDGYQLKNDTRVVLQFAEDGDPTLEKFIIWTKNVKQTFTKTSDIAQFIRDTNYEGHVILQCFNGIFVRDNNYVMSRPDRLDLVDPLIV